MIKAAWAATIEEQQPFSHGVVEFLLMVLKNGISQDCQDLIAYVTR